MVTSCSSCSSSSTSGRSTITCAELVTSTQIRTSGRPFDHVADDVEAAVVDVTFVVQAKLLHHAGRGAVFLERDRDDAVEPCFPARVQQRRPGFGGVAAAPRGGDDV